MSQQFVVQLDSIFRTIYLNMRIKYFAGALASLIFGEMRENKSLLLNLKELLCKSPLSTLV